MKVVQLHQNASDRFEEFWQWCPKRVKKALTKAKWDAITNGGLNTRIFDNDSQSYVAVTLQATADELIMGIKAYRATQIDPKKCRSDDLKNLVLKEEGKYTLHPSSWLNQGRWMDE